MTFGFASMLLVASCLHQEESARPAAVGAQAAIPAPGTARYHAHQVEQELGPLPNFTCSDAVEIPITQNGVPVFEDVDWCDNPAAFGDPCQVGNRVGRYEGTYENGDPRPEVVFLTFCRDGGMGVLGYNSKTGAAAFFSIEEGAAAFGDVPGPDDPGYEEAWQSPAVVAADGCVNCHMADPYLHTPWIDQVRQPANPSELLVPFIESPRPPYFIVGDGFAQPAVANLKGNACVKCHRAQCGSIFDGDLDELYIPGTFWEAHYDSTWESDLAELKEWCDSLDVMIF